MKKRMIGIFLIGLLLLGSILPVSANSAETYWEGVDGTGSAVKDSNCPLEVAKEVLTFDISEFPAEYYSEKTAYLAYSGKVTAEYTFYNPSDYTVTATLAFPFGTQPSYVGIYDETDKAYLANADTEKYDITVNGEAVTKRIRYTLQTNRTFSVSEDLAKLSDTYIADSFYCPDTTVTKYTYIIGGLDKEKYRAANVAFDWRGGDGNTKLYFPEQSGFHLQKDGDGRLSMWADNGEEFSVYAIGQPLSEPLVMTCYENGGVKDKKEIDGNVTCIKTESMTWEEMALEHWRAETGVSRVDWYNAVLEAFRSGEDENYHDIRMDLGLTWSAESWLSAMMRWYEYEITVSPGESVLNTVSAPLYPTVRSDYEPNIYQYTYLLSPASTWAKFGELTIVVHTPYYMTESALEGWAKTDTGYMLTRNGLPNEECQFTLSTVEDPVAPMYSLRDKIPTEIIIVGAVSATICLLMGGGIAALVIVRHKKKAKKAKRNAL